MEKSGYPTVGQQRRLQDSNEVVSRGEVKREAAQQICWFRSSGLIEREIVGDTDGERSERREGEDERNKP